MADETATTTETESTTTSTEQGTASGDSNAGTGTQTQQTTEAAKTFTQAEVDAMFQRRLSKAVKAELKKMSGEEDGQPTVQELQQGKETAERALAFYQARDQVEDFIADKKNGANIKNVRAFCRYFKDDFQFEDGKVTNLKDLYLRAKTETPELLGMVTGSIDGAAGNNTPPGTNDMNSMIRRASGRG